MKRFLFFGVVLAFLLSLFTPGVAKAEAADDITGHFFEEDMRNLIDEGILKGYGDNTYLPEKPVNRSEFTAFLVRALDLEMKAAADYSVAQVSESPSFSDVTPEDWFYPSVITASTQSLVNGYPDGSFRPKREISREEMAVMIMRAADLKGVVSEKEPLNFDDNEEIQDIYREAVQRLTNLGILTGKVDSEGNKFFDPKASTTRAQTAGVINRLLNIINPPVPLNYEVATLSTDGEPEVTGKYETFEEAKSHVSGNQVVMNGSNIVWINDGMVVSNKFAYVYPTESLATASTYVTSGIEMKYLGATETWVKVQIADTVGYIDADAANLNPSHMVTKRSYYEARNGDLYHHIYNPITEGIVSYVYGKAPSFLSEGKKYYSWNGNTFYNTTGDQVGDAYQYFNRMPLYSKTQYTAEQLNQFIAAKRPGSPLIGLGEAFKKAEELHGTNAMYLLSHAIIESRWGESDIARDKNNLFGINAVDANPYENATTYDSYEDGILEAAEQFIVPGYFKDENWRFNGAHLGNKSTGMNVRYASDPYWGQKISSIMYQMDQYLSSTLDVPAEYGQYGLAVSKQNNTNVRSTAKVDNNDIYQLKKAGSTVQILDEVSANGTWYKIAPKNISDRSYEDAFVYSHGGSYGTLFDRLNIAQ
ncbi:S-layer homology domain-containing protein [Halobacillus sp. BBL2006]|uniref:S-layer homology domain-containing protein n=1 Tax=Halobacillus sp. BBL2006 TaxID=1543706 RepID=UPI000541E436|nr:S-layer homology domain-containing protein [Halobacillus sp. BBL2006]KHE71910.1 S-layer protein [Halobacillus sp. BBL2006]